MKPRCVCGCGRRSANKHHVIYAQEIRQRVRKGGRSYAEKAEASRRQAEVLKDQRNLVPMAFDCHMRHHSRELPLRLSVLPDSVYEFAVELMGAGAAYEFLRRRYDGPDARLDALLEAEAA